MKRNSSTNKARDDHDHEIPHIPPEVLQDILSRLPVESLIRSKTVNKWCHRLFSDARFSRLHLAQSTRQNRIRFMSLHDYPHCTLAYEATCSAHETNRRICNNDESEDGPVVDFLASCHGMFCVGNADDKLFLWNPSTTERKKIPSSKIEFPTSPPCTWASVFFGLGFHSASDDYKLVRVAMFNGEDFRTEVKVYSRNSKTWRRITDFPYNFPSARPGVFVGKNLHWMIINRQDSVQTYMIAALNLEDESYKLMTLPVPIRKVEFTDIGALGENLILFCSYQEFKSYEYNIWILKEYGKAEAWTRVKVVDSCMANIEASVYFEPLCLVGAEEILIRIGPKRFLIYNARHNTGWEFFMPMNKETRMVSFIESLVSPNA